MKELRLLPDGQASFRKGENTTNNVFVVVSVTLKRNVNLRKQARCIYLHVVCRSERII